MYKKVKYSLNKLSCLVFAVAVVMMIGAIFFSQKSVAAQNNDLTSASTSSSVVAVAFDGKCSDKVLTAENCSIVAYILTFTNFLSAIVGIVIVIMIAMAGIQYSAARDNPQAVAAAKGRIYNAIFALIFYMFGFAFLQWLVPGGLF